MHDEPNKISALWVNYKNILYFPHIQCNAIFSTNTDLGVASSKAHKIRNKPNEKNSLPIQKNNYQCQAKTLLCKKGRNCNRM